MTESLKKFQLQNHLSDEDVRHLTDQMHSESFRKNDFVIEEGTRNSNLYLVTKGILRYVADSIGYEITYWFVLPGEITFSTWGYVNNARSQMSIIAATDAEVLVISKEKLNELFESSLKMANLGRRLMEQYNLQYEEGMLNYYDNPNATARYEYMMRRYPQVIQEVPLQYIASYLGITPQSLSRIRAEYRRRSRRE